MKPRNTVVIIAVMVALMAVAGPYSHATESPLQKKVLTPAPASPAVPSNQTPVLTPARPELEIHQVGLPDLVIQAIRTGEPARAGDRMEVPISVRIRNRGESPAGVFKVAARYRFLSFPVVLAPRLTVREGLVPFNVPGQRNTMFPFTTESLNAGGEITFTGKLIFPTIFDRSFDSSTPMVRIRFEAFADSIEGEGSSMPTHGRVREADENNNRSNPIDIEMSITRGPGDRKPINRTSTGSMTKEWRDEIMKKSSFPVIIGALVIALACFGLVHAGGGSVTLPKGTKAEKLAPGHFRFKLPNGKIVEVSNFNPKTGVGSQITLTDPGKPGTPVASGSKGTLIRTRQLSRKEAANLKPDNYITIDDEVTWLPATISFKPNTVMTPEPSMRSLGDPDPPPRALGDPDPPLHR